MHRRSNDRSESHSIVNVRLLLVVFVVLAVGGTTAFLLHQRNERRNARAFLTRAEESSEKGEHAEAAQWLAQYIQLRPDDYESRVLLAHAVDKSAHTPAAKVQAAGYYS